MLVQQISVHCIGLFKFTLEGHISCSLYPTFKSLTQYFRWKHKLLVLIAVICFLFTGATLNDFCAVEVASSELPCGLERLESHKAVQPTFGIGANPTLSSLSRKKTANASGIPESHPP